MYEHFHKKRSHMHGKRAEYKIPLYIIQCTAVATRAQPAGGQWRVIILSQRTRVLNW